MSRRARRSRAGRGPQRIRWKLRRGSRADIDVLVRHRHGMFTEIGGRTQRQLARHDPVYRRWLIPRMETGEAVMLVLEAPDHAPVASGGLWFRPEQPRPEAARPRVPYVFSMYTEPRYRRRGLARRLVAELLGIARQRGYPRVVLHAAPAARRIYGRAGFERTWEMRAELAVRRSRPTTVGRRRQRSGGGG